MWRCVETCGDVWRTRFCKRGAMFKRSESKLGTVLDLCVSSLRRRHANLSIVQIASDDPQRVWRARSMEKKSPPASKRLAGPLLCPPLILAFLSLISWSSRYSCSAVAIQMSFRLCSSLQKQNRTLLLLLCRPMRSIGDAPGFEDLQGIAWLPRFPLLDCAGCTRSDSISVHRTRAY